jgi:hypothetical protein
MYNAGKLVQGENEMRPSLGVIPMDQCIPRRVYQIHCRNLHFGVWNGKASPWAGFIGIREKFGSKYLFTEYHHDTGAPYGTVFEHKDLGIDCPADIVLAERLHDFDQLSGRHVKFDKPVADGGRGWYFLDDNSACDLKKTQIYAQRNDALFNFLTEIEKTYGEQERLQ